MPQTFNLLAMLPEIALLLVACIVLLADATAPATRAAPRIDRLALAVLLLPLAAIIYVGGATAIRTPSATCTCPT